MTKVCNHCGQSKPVEEFNWRWKARGVRQRTCRDCQNGQKQAWYERNKDTHKQNTYRNKLSKRDVARKYIWDYLSAHPCACGESDPMVLEFHHVRGRKKKEVTKLVSLGYSLETIQKEMDKCIVVCANCHKRMTYNGTWRG